MSQKKLLDFIIRQTAKEVLVDEEIVDTIVRHQWAQLYQHSYDLMEMEIAGIGSIYPTAKKVLQRIAYYEKQLSRQFILQQEKDCPEVRETIREYSDRLMKMRKKKDELDRKSMEK